MRNYNWMLQQTEAIKSALIANVKADYAQGMADKEDMLIEVAYIRGASHSKCVALLKQYGIEAPKPDIKFW